MLYGSCGFTVVTLYEDNLYRVTTVDVKKTYYDNFKVPVALCGCRLGSYPSPPCKLKKTILLLYTFDGQINPWEAPKPCDNNKRVMIKPE